MCDETMKELLKLQKENSELRQRVTELNEQVEDLKKRLTRPGRQKDDPRMMEKRKKFARLYNDGKVETEICDAMQISSRTYDRLKTYAKLNGMLEE